MQKNGGLWIALGGGRRSEKVLASIERHSAFTEVVVGSEIRPKSFELALISISGQKIDFVGISKAGRHVATDKQAIAVSNLIEIRQVSLSVILEALPKRLRRWAALRSYGCTRVSPKLWESLLYLLYSMRPALTSDINQLQRTVDDAVTWSQEDGGIRVLERDAVASAVQAWGGNALRKQVLRTAARSTATYSAPFLANLEGALMGEDSILYYDQCTFPGFEAAKPHIIGAVQLSRGSETLTILNCNRQPLEQTLGVDLIYYNHSYNSFILVQYKRMNRSSAGHPVYYPYGDKNYQSELQRMLTFDLELQNLPKRDNSPEHCRLSDRPFFIKLCEPIAKHSLDEGMSSGMYVPLEVWQCLLSSPRVQGPRGGIGIGWHNCSRRLSNSEFTHLLRQGWIGSAATGSTRLSQVIEEVLKSRRMLVLAGVTSSTRFRDFHRDTIGQFASPKDPLASL